MSHGVSEKDYIEAVPNTIKNNPKISQTGNLEGRSVAVESENKNTCKITFQVTLVFGVFLGLLYIATRGARLMDLADKGDCTHTIRYYQNLTDGCLEQRVSGGALLLAPIILIYCGVIAHQLFNKYKLHSS